MQHNLFGEFCKRIFFSSSTNVKLFRVLSSSFLGVLLLVGLPFFFYGGPGYHSNRSLQAAWDLGHTLFFAIATLWLYGLIKKRVAHHSWIRLFLFFSLVVLGCGMLVEFLQGYTTGGRSPDMMDVLRNQLGCMLAFACCIRPHRNDTPPMVAWLFSGAALVLLVIAAWPLARAVIDEQLAIRQFPVLADFETPFEQYRWVNTQQMRTETVLVRHGKKAMRVQLSTAKFSGIALFFFPGNWQGYRSLHCSIYNPRSTALSLNFRIHDAQHKQHSSEFSDRFNKQVTLHQGWNDLAIDLDKVRNAPRGRPMDMGHIEGFGLFVVQQAKPMEIILDHIALAR